VTEAIYKVPEYIPSEYDEEDDDDEDYLADE
jgi:hypothetical protein